eukprot:CAMPEP_0179152776 /NCGR_PEP_ID=MMETSP0796-20121207/74255_1 /TAXON_ID=73915 /ORGANISM="Pyrodinium bahamense, Strain pbaha01" /LENGTH=83 /DNA_ID=CAMNT_0020853999 /DNA_START=159 /DNA_END=407 /DNA_ORIENTATION=-
MAATMPCLNLPQTQCCTADALWSGSNVALSPPPLCASSLMQSGWGSRYGTRTSRAPTIPSEGTIGVQNRLWFRPAGSLRWHLE